MKSINGFNNSSLQGSSNLSALNSIGAGVDIAKTAMSNDIHFQTSTGGTSYALPQEVYDTVFESKQFTVSVYKVGEQYRFKVTPGTINGLVPCIGGLGFASLLVATNPVPYGLLNFSGEGNCWIYLRAGPKTGTAKLWPDPNIANTTYPSMIATNIIQEDTDNFGHILIALVNKNPETSAITVNQFVQNSVWSQRNKYTLPDSSYYFFWPI